MIQIIAKKLSSLASTLTRMRILAQLTSPTLQQPLSNQKQSAVYCGYDPTAKSLHIGHLPSIVAMINLQKLGVRPIFLVGGATGRIGDPSGKQKQRPEAKYQQIIQNSRSIQLQLDQVYRRLCAEAKIQQPKGLIINNQIFYQQNILDFLSKVGRHFRVNEMIKRDSIKQRLQSHDGINLNQFVYTIFQGYDFLKLFQNFNCRYQIGGSDQYSNIISGITLIKKLHNQEAFGATLKLLTTSQGVKLGKSQGNSLFLDSKGQSIFHYIINLPDSYFPDLFYQLTFKEPVETDVQSQKRQLALYISLLLSKSNEQEVMSQQKYFKINFPQLNNLQNSQIVQYFQFEKNRVKLLLYKPLIQSLQIVFSHNALKKNADQGSLRVNGRKISKGELFRKWSQEELLGGRFMVLKFGRKRFVLLQYTYE